MQWFTAHPFLLMAVAGMLAGAMNALAGGGTFVTLPAMLAIGMPSVVANTSSTVALYPAQLTTAWAYRDGLGPVGSVSLKVLLAATLAGGAVGATLLLLTSSDTFSRALPWLLLVATVMLGFGRQFGEALRRRWHIGPPAVIAIQLLLGVYGGYFGGAVGLMMMAAWGLLDNRSLKSFNAPRTLLVAAANTVAVLIFVTAGSVRWPEAAVMLAAAAVGGYFGAMLGRRANAQAVRWGTVIISAGITVAFFVKAYGRST
jgi:uncharacterized membrane protein YfcA